MLEPSNLPLPLFFEGLCTSNTEGNFDNDISNVSPMYTQIGTQINSLKK